MRYRGYMSFTGTKRLMCSLALFGGVLTIPSSATSVLFSGANGNLMGSANFVLVGNTLTIEVKNESNVAATAPSEVLTGIFFDLAGNPVTNLQSIAVDSASSIVNCVGSCGAGTVVDTNVAGFQGGWQYLAGINNALTGNYGAGTAGFGIFNGNNTGGGGGCAANQQFCFGLIPVAGASHPTFNGKQFINNGIVVTLALTGQPQDYDIGDAVANLRLQFGGSLTDPSITTFQVFPGPNPGRLTENPEPATYVLMGAGLAALVAFHKRRAAK